LKNKRFFVTQPATKEGGIMKKFLLLFVIFILSFSILLGNSNSTPILNDLNEHYEVFKALYDQSQKFNLDSKLPVVIQRMFDNQSTENLHNRVSIYNVETTREYMLYQMLYETWEGGEWVYISLETFTYNDQNQMIEILTQIWEFGAWVNSMNFINTYDINGNIIEMMIQMWDATGWLDYMIMTIEYNEYNLIYQIQTEINMFVEWIIISITTYYYDGDLLLIEEITQAHDFFSGLLVNSDRTTYFYDAQENQIERIYQIWIDNDWVNDARTTWQYDGNNYETERMHQYWIGADWENSTRYTSSYDASYNLIEELKEIWSPYRTWDYYRKWIYSYEAQGVMTEILAQDWEGGAWVNDYLFTYTYDGDDYLIEELGETWEGSWVYDERITYTYQETNTEDTVIDNLMISLYNYPNPFNPETTISFSLAKNTKYAELIIYNIKGQKIRELPIVTPSPSQTLSVTWNGTDDYGKPVSSGIYLYKLRTEDNSKLKRMMLLK
jgi:hypothetical protein